MSNCKDKMQWCEAASLIDEWVEQCRGNGIVGGRQPSKCPALPAIFQRCLDHTYPNPNVSVSFLPRELYGPALDDAEGFKSNFGSSSYSRPREASQRRQQVNPIAFPQLSVHCLFRITLILLLSYFYTKSLDILILISLRPRSNKIPVPGHLIS